MKGKNTAKNILSSLILQLVLLVSNFLIPILIISTYGSATNGLINSITQFLAYIALLESGFGPVVKSILYKPLAKKDKHTIESILHTSEKFFRNIAKIFIVYIIGLCIFFPLITKDQFEPWYTVSLIIIMAISTFSEYFFGMTYRLFLQANKQTYITTRIQIATTIINTIVIITLINMGASIQFVKLATAVIFIFRPIIQNIYVKKKYSLTINTSKKLTYKIEQKWDGLAQHIAAVIHSNTDIAVITLFSTMSEVSVYSVYMMIVTGVKNIVQSFNAGVDASFGHMLAKREHHKLRRKFSSYELFYHSISSIIFIATTILIVPFVSVYTQKITDTDYVRPLFGILITISEFIWAIRLPYSSTTLAAGHFKETRKGAWLEAIINIVISAILVFNFGIVGVAIGTIVAMLVRTIEFMYHTSKYILKRNIWQSFIWLPIITIETVFTMLLVIIINLPAPINYLQWAINACIVVAAATICVVPTNLLTHPTSTSHLVEKVKKSIKKLTKL